jgi:hypothetical protein
MSSLLATIAFSLAASQIDPSAMTLLARMSSTLSEAESLVVTARIEREERGSDGQMLNFYSTTQAALKRPNRLYTATAGDVQPYATWYDGAVLTVYMPLSKTYGRTLVAENNDSLLKRLSGHFEMSSPLAPFLSSNPYAQLRRQIRTAKVIQDVQAGDVLCRQIAFTGRDVDWQLWITIDDDTPLPARMAAIFKHRPGKPRVVVEFERWDLDVTLTPSTFRFDPPTGANAATMIF